MNLRWVRFSVRALMLFTVIVALGFGAFASLQHQFQREMRTLQEMQVTNLTCGPIEFGAGDRYLSNVTEPSKIGFTVDGTYVTLAWQAPRWTESICSWVDPKLLYRVEWIHIQNVKYDQRLTPFLAQFTSLRMIDLQDVAIAEAEQTELVSTCSARGIRLIRR